jgi:HD-GYP domain-containing protein (c-di-GMP phosphodiesterase class II)
MSEAEAFSILQARRGSMYDPLVVDAFIEMQTQPQAADVVPTANEVTIPFSLPLSTSLRRS